MADVVDDAQAVSDLHLRHSLAAARRPIAIGYPGECENCDRESKRLVQGWCAPCRDRRAKVSAR